MPEGKPIHAEPAVPGNREKTRLNHDFTFDTLVTGRANDLTRAAASAGLTESRQLLQPVIHLRRRLNQGKTHLVQSIGNEVLRQNPRSVIRYVHAEDYVADVVRAYQQKSFDQFKRYYRSLDLLT